MCVCSAKCPCVQLTVAVRHNAVHSGRMQIHGVGARNCCRIDRIKAKGKKNKKIFLKEVLFSYGALRSNFFFSSSSPKRRNAICKAMVCAAHKYFSMRRFFAKKRKFALKKHRVVTFVHTQSLVCTHTLGSGQICVFFSAARAVFSTHVIMCVI